MKRLLFLTLVVLIGYGGITLSESVDVGKMTTTVVDSIAVADTVATAARSDVDTFPTVDIRKYEKLSFVFMTTHDTNFTDDTTGYVMHYSIDDSAWTLLDTIKKSFASDLTFQSAYYALDTMPPMNYLRLIMYHNDVMEADEPALITNTYNYTGNVWIKGWK